MVEPVESWGLAEVRGEGQETWKDGMWGDLYRFVLDWQLCHQQGLRQLQAGDV